MINVICRTGHLLEMSRKYQKLQWRGRLRSIQFDSMPKFDQRQANKEKKKITRGKGPMTNGFPYNITPIKPLESVVTLD